MREIDTEIFIESMLADAVWNEASNRVEYVSRGTIVAGVVNHHALAADLIASFFARLRTSRPELRRIVIVAPDHYSVGRDEMSTTLRPYRVGAEVVSIDTDAARNLIRDGVATEEDGALFEREHGIGALVPFIVRAYPDVQIVPVVFRGSVSKERLQSLTKALKKMWDDQTVIVISADMSHYLTSSKALGNDTTTLRSLETKDVGIASFTDDFIDSGKSVAALFAAMSDSHPDASFIPFDHAISSDYGADPGYTTSYITGVWEE